MHPRLTFLGGANAYCMYLCRIDAGVAASPEAMVGRELRVLWPEDNAWFSGTVDSYDSTSGKHKVGGLHPHCSVMWSTTAVL